MNPYSLVFGIKPDILIERIPSSQEIIHNFLSKNSNHVYMITGIRGTGKTIVMTQIANYFRKLEDWEVIDLSPDMDLLESFAVEMGVIPELRKLFQVEKIAVSLPGISIDIKNNDAPIKDAKVAVTRMLEVAKKHGKHVLVTIDETINNASVKTFASVFQILLRQELPIYLVMTGLYENIRMLQNEKTLTFLYRTPRIILNPLEIATVARSYAQTFKLNREESRKMANLTKGYPFAFQILGYYTWEYDGDFNSCINEYKYYLYDYSYDKIWMELSPKDREFVTAIAKTGTGKTADIKESLNISQNDYNPYRKRLIDRGIILSADRGSVEFTLPFFGEFALEREAW